MEGLFVTTVILAIIVSVGAIGYCESIKCTEMMLYCGLVIIALVILSFCAHGIYEQGRADAFNETGTFVWQPKATTQP